MPASTTPDPITSSGLWELAVGLLVVCIAIFVLGWVMKRLQPGAIGLNGQMKIVGSLALGPRERVVIVDCAGKQMLLGVTQGQINHLAELETPVNTNTPPAGGDFADKLRQVLNRGGDA